MSKESGFFDKSPLVSLGGIEGISQRGRESVDKSTSVFTATVQVLEANPKRLWAAISIDTTGGIAWLNLGEEPAVANKGIYMKEGTPFFIDQFHAWTGQVQAISTGAGVNMNIIEVSVL